MHAFIEIQTKFIQQTNSKIPLWLFFFPPAAVFAHIQARPIESILLSFLYESCFLLRNNNFFSVHTPAYRTRKDIKIKGDTIYRYNINERIPAKNIRQAICLYIVLRNKKNQIWKRRRMIFSLENILWNLYSM